MLDFIYMGSERMESEKWSMSKHSESIALAGMSPTGPNKVERDITLEDKLCFDTRMAPTARKSKRAILVTYLYYVKTISYTKFQVNI